MVCYISQKLQNQCDGSNRHQRVCSAQVWLMDPKQKRRPVEALRLLLQDQVHVRSGHQTLRRDAELLHQTFCHLRSRRSASPAGWQEANQTELQKFQQLLNSNSLKVNTWAGVRSTVTGRVPAVFSHVTLTCCPSSTLCSGLITTWTQTRVSSVPASSHLDALA